MIIKKTKFQKKKTTLNMYISSLHQYSYYIIIIIIIFIMRYY